jgi:hypothetical protein
MAWWSSSSDALDSREADVARLLPRSRFEPGLITRRITKVSSRGNPDVDQLRTTQSRAPLIDKTVYRTVLQRGVDAVERGT